MPSVLQRLFRFEDTARPSQLVPIKSCATAAELWHAACVNCQVLETLMWAQIGAAAGAILVMFAIFKRVSRPKSRNIDVGAVSDAWLAEHRARGRDSV